MAQSAGARRIGSLRLPRRFPWHVVAFLAPALGFYTLFMVFPLFDSLRLSLFAPSATGGAEFVGIGNYVRMLTTAPWADGFLNAFRNNFLFFLVHMLVQNPIGLLLAVLLTGKLRGAGIYRGIIFIPTIFSVVIVGFIWKLILSPLWGVAEGAMGTVGLGHLYAPWLGLQGPALIALALMSVWQWMGIPMLLFSAALLGISDEVIEAAKTDGASGWQVFRRVQLPMILPTVGIVANYSTDLLAVFFYRTFFGYNLQQPSPVMGTTIAGLMFLIILAVVLAYFFILQRRLQTYEA
jgi:raffinose/stachyose/melibiose transport system permease protein